MKEYVFVLGRDKDLSLLEIVSYFIARNIEFLVKQYRSNILIVSLPSLDFSKIINELGGTIKIGEVISNKSNLNDLDNINMNFTQKKLFFSLSIYDNAQIADKISSYFKDRFRKENIKFVFRKFFSGDSPKRLINKHDYHIFDIIVFSNYIARTIAVSNPSFYKKLDKRPENDFLKSTSARLAKILVNLSQVKEKQTLLDPFCGVGGLLQQALLMNINVIGIDNDKKSVYQSTKNLGWTKDVFNCKANFKVIKGDARNLNKILEGNSIDAVVTEPYLGPYIKRTLTKKEVLNIANNLQSLYSNFFNSLVHILKKGSLVVFIVPKFRTKEGDFVEIVIDKVINKTFKLYKISDLVNLPIQYYGINKKIVREIFIFRKIN